ncbi:MAG: ABC transporter permease subunit [Acidimicrobiales bacterium]
MTAVEPAAEPGVGRRARLGGASLDPVRVLAPIALFVLFIGAWEAWLVIGNVPELLLPAPHQILSQFIEDRSKLSTFAGNTLAQALKGVAVGSVFSLTLAGLVFRVPVLAKALQTYASTIKALPVVALYPICTVFFGITDRAVVAIVAVGITPIVFAYALTGFSTRSEQDELFRSLSAGFWVRFRLLVLPRSAPYLMAALKTVVPTSIIIAVIAQYFGGSVTSLGAYIRRESANLHVLEMWSAIVASCLLGLSCFAVVALADRLVRRWLPTAR